MVFTGQVPFLLPNQHCQSTEASKRRNWCCVGTDRLTMRDERRCIMCCVLVTTCITTQTAPVHHCLSTRITPPAPTTSSSSWKRLPTNWGTLSMVLKSAGSIAVKIIDPKHVVLTDSITRLYNVSGYFHLSNQYTCLSFYFEDWFVKLHNSSLTHASSQRPPAQPSPSKHWMIGTCHLQ